MPSPTYPEHTINGHPVSISLPSLGDWNDTDAPCGLNWSAYGNVTTQDARNFIAALTKAVEEAERRNQPCGDCGALNGQHTRASCTE